jgi:hypothetical protein
MPDLLDSYTSALNDYVRSPDEGGLFAAYELGRRAVVERIGLLDFMMIHHDALAEALAGQHRAAAPEILGLAARFVTQSLASFEMVQRGAQDAVHTASRQERSATVVRRLSTLLADTSLASDDGGSLEEMLNLVAEHARELAAADRCAIRVDCWDGRILAADPPQSSNEPRKSAGSVVIELKALDGRPLGVLRAERDDRRFNDGEMATLEHLAQMAAGAVDRHHHYAN